MQCYPVLAPSRCMLHHLGEVGIILALNQILLLKYYNDMNS